MSWCIFPHWLCAETARVCPCLSNLGWTLWYCWKCKGVCVLLTGSSLRCLGWQAKDKLVTDWQTDRAGSVGAPALHYCHWFLDTCGHNFIYTWLSDANACASSTEAGDKRRRKEDKMDAKPGVTDVWEEVLRVISAWFFHVDRFLNKLFPTPAEHLSPSK